MKSVCVLKNELKNEYDEYLSEHPEVRSLMADFMQSVLSAKPDDVLAFSAKHFASYSTRTRPDQLLAYANQKTNIPKLDNNIIG